jgi:hypothetical protein
LATQHAHVPEPIIEDSLHVSGAGLGRVERWSAAEASAAATTTSAALRVSRQHTANRESRRKGARRDESSKRHQTPRRASENWLLVDYEIELFVAELETPDETRRISVPRRKGRDLEALARFDGRLVEPLSYQVLN